MDSLEYAIFSQQNNVAFSLSESVWRERAEAERYLAIMLGKPHMRAWMVIRPQQPTLESVDLWHGLAAQRINPKRSVLANVPILTKRRWT